MPQETTTDAEREGDAALIAACVAHAQHWANTMDERPDGSDPWAERLRELDRIIRTTPATTLAGLAAKASVVRADICREVDDAALYGDDAAFEVAAPVSLADDILAMAAKHREGTDAERA